MFKLLPAESVNKAILNDDVGDKFNIICLN